MCYHSCKCSPINRVSEYTCFVLIAHSNTPAVQSQHNVEEEQNNDEDKD